MRTSQGLALTMLILGGWLTHNLERIHKDIARITSDNVDPGGWLTHNLERIHEDIARITSDNVDPGGQLTHNLERIHKDIARITSDNVDPGWGQSTHNLERIREDIASITSDNVDLGLNQHTTWKGSMRTLQGLPLTVLIWGVCQSTHNLERIHEDIARITSDNVDPGGVNWHTTWKGSARTLQGLPLTMLTLEGSINMQLGKDPWGHCKDYLWECWSWGSIDTQLGKDPQGHCKDYLWQCLSWVGSIDTQLGKDPWGHCKDYLWQCWSGA